MSGKHRTSKSTGKGPSGRSLPVKVPTAAKSTSARRKTKTISARHKLALFLTSPAVISGIAGAIPPYTITAAQMVAHEITTQSPRNKSLDSFSARGRHDVPIGSGGFAFGGAWGDYANATITNQGIATHLASMVVDVASEDARFHGAFNAAERWRYTQWVLAGNMTPAEAAELVTTESPTPKLETLLDLIQKDHSIVTTSGTVTHQPITQEQSVPPSAQPETKFVRQQRQRQSRSKRSGKR